MTEQDKEQLNIEISRIFESGANHLRIFEMVENFIDKRYKAINYTRCCTELPNIYEKELNSERVKIINTLSNNYNVDKSTIRSLFCDGADWYKQKLTK